MDFFQTLGLAMVGSSVAIYALMYGLYRYRRRHDGERQPRP